MTIPWDLISCKKVALRVQAKP